MKNSKILVIGDLHIGNNRNNPDFFKIVLEYGDWINHICETRNIKNIVQLGDVFHFREMVHNPSINCAHQFFEKLQKYNIHIITGNHDSFYNDSSEVHSLKLLSNWPNITVHEKVSVLDNVCFCGWGAKIDDIPDSDILFGHFDIKGFQVSSTKVSEHGFSATELMQKCKILMSGHYHKPQIRFYDKKPLVYSGSAFQLNWGESGEKKYVYVLDSDSLQYEMIENEISPRFEYIRNEKDYEKANNNFVSVEISDPNEFNKIVIKLKKLNAKDVRTTIKPVKQISDSVAMTEFKGVNFDDAAEEYTGLLEVDIDEKKYLAEHFKQLYKTCTR